MADDSRYEETTQTMWIYKDYHGGDDLVSKDEIKRWSGALKSGQTDSGQPLQRVNYVFPDTASAEYNASALAFARLGTFVGDLEAPTKFGGDTPSFDTKEDFGI